MKILKVTTNVILIGLAIKLVMALFGHEILTTASYVQNALTAYNQQAQKEQVTYVAPQEHYVEHSHRNHPYENNDERNRSVRVLILALGAIGLIAIFLLKPTRNSDSYDDYC